MKKNGYIPFICIRSSEIDQVKAQVESLQEEISQLNSEREELLAEIDVATRDANTNIESITAQKVSMTYNFLLIISCIDLTLIILNC